VNIALALVGLGYKQVCYVSANAVLVGHCIPAEDFLEARMRLATALVNAAQYLHACVDQSAVAVLPLDH
jgi:hypothetical protein